MQLEPLQASFVAELTAAAAEDRSTYDWTAVPASEPAMQAYVDRLLADQTAGNAMVFAQRRSVDNALVGCTRYMRLEWWAGRPLPVEVEIGGTWLAASAQRTAINTEAKFLLLRHAFESYGVNRVTLCTDMLNERSRAAILRIGATFEGVLHSHRESYAHPGAPRDSAVYGIIASDWPRVGTALLTRLGHPD
ncbi:MAG: GNAT family protein [Ilumatobacteraceae bacterium]